MQDGQKLKILKVIGDYDCLHFQQLEEEANCSGDKLKSILSYLRIKKAITFDGNFEHIQITTAGTDTINKNKKTIDKIELGLNIGVFNIKWSREKR